MKMSYVLSLVRYFRPLLKNKDPFAIEDRLAEIDRAVQGNYTMKSAFDMDSSLMLAEDPVIGGIEYKGSGKWELGDAIGIGADFDEDVLGKMESVMI